MVGFLRPTPAAGAMKNLPVVEDFKPVKSANPTPCKGRESSHT